MKRYYRGIINMEKSVLQVFSKVYIYIIALSTLPLMYLTRSFLVPDILLETFFWIAVLIIADLKPIVMPKGDGICEVTMSFVAQLASVILFGTSRAVWIVVIATLAAELIQKKPLYKGLFNAGQYGLSLLITGTLFYSLKLSPDSVPLDIVRDFPSLMISVTVYFLLNTFFVAAVISLTTASNFVGVFLSDIKLMASYYFSLSPLSAAAALLYNPKFPFIIFTMIPPVIIADSAFRRYNSLHLETRETLKVLADTIDERDEYTFAHSSRVAEYAKKISQHMNLPLDKVDEIESSGQVHDLGKIRIEDRILQKRGKLTDEEYAKIKQHPETAYRILKNLKPYKNCAEYVLYHHEHYNGCGYPKGISGNEIPIGARILAVADSFDAMTSDRPYRKALSRVVAVNELEKCSGSQFDPEVVRAFIEVQKSDYNYTEE
jgi:HD-GYP domain-containing protein (c-di-GMP phosphodiesterase class II)